MSNNKPILTAGNDFYLRVNVYTRNAQGEREPFNLSACDKWAFYLKSSYGAITKTTFGLEEGSLNTILVDCKEIKRSMGYTAEVVAVLNGRNVRCAERGVFAVTDYNADANVTFEVYEAEKGQDLDMEFQIVSSAEIVGKNAYELAVEQGYEGTLGDWLADIVHDADYVHTDNNFTDEHKEAVENIPEWALQPTKPTYTPEEVGAPSTQEFEDAVVTEQQARQQAIAAEQQARQNADTALLQNILSEQQARQAADASLQQAIDTEETAREDAIAAEQQVRQQADKNLYDRIRIIPSTGNNAVSQKDTGAVAAGEAAMAVGLNTKASGPHSFAEGEQTDAIGLNSHAEGGATKASGFCGHAEGYGAKATGANSHAEGTGSEASNGSAHAEGFQCLASGDCSHAEGYQTIASGHQAHAGGINSRATAQCSFASGWNTLADNPASAAFGKFNKSTTGKTLFAVGAGTSDSNRRNVFEVQEDGSILLRINNKETLLQQLIGDILERLTKLEQEGGAV